MENEYKIINIFKIDLIGKKEGYLCQKETHWNWLN